MDADEYWSKKRFDDYLTRRPGTIMGDVARERDKMFEPKSLASLNRTAGTSATRRHTSPRAPSGPWFPGVDAWFDRHLPMPLRRKLALGLIALGAFLGIGLAPQLGITTGWAVGLGAFAGLALIPALMFAVKLMFFALMVGFAALVGYLVYLAVMSA